MNSYIKIGDWELERIMKGLERAHEPLDLVASSYTSPEIINEKEYDQSTDIALKNYEN